MGETAVPSSSSRKPLELTTTVSRVRQGDVTFLSFALPATVYAALAHPIRFSDDPVRGVQRDLKESQVVGLMEAMRKGRQIPANVTLNLTGWIEEGGQLLGMEGSSFIEALDGQHRGEAVRRLLEAGEDDVLGRYEFLAMAVMDAPDELRRALFMAQIEALGVSREHAATMRSRSGQYSTPYLKEAADIAAALDTRSDSPLQGRVHWGDVPRGARNAPVMPDGKWVTLATLERAVHGAIAGRKSVAAGLSGTEARMQFAVDLLSAARECYPTQFAEEGTLCTPFGLQSLFLLASRKESGFRTRLQDAGCTRAEMVRLMKLVPRFHWSVRDDGVHIPAAVVERFNDRLSAALRR